MDVGSNYCGLSISGAHPDDTGEWECRVMGGSSTTPEYAYVVRIKADSKKPYRLMQFPLTVTSKSLHRISPRFTSPNRTFRMTTARQLSTTSPEAGPRSRSRALVTEGGLNRPFTGKRGQTDFQVLDDLVVTSVCSDKNGLCFFQVHQRLTVSWSPHLLQSKAKLELVDPNISPRVSPVSPVGVQTEFPELNGGPQIRALESIHEGIFRGSHVECVVRIENPGHQPAMKTEGPR